MSLIPNVPTICSAISVALCKSFEAPVVIFPKTTSSADLPPSRVATLLGGRSAEEVVFGKITTGASNDLQRATDIAEQMVGTFGMSDILGPLAYDKQGGGQFLGNGNNPRRSVSDATAQA